MTKQSLEEGDQGTAPVQQTRHEQIVALHKTLAKHFPDSVYCILVRPRAGEEEGELETTITGVFPILSPTFRAFEESGVDLKSAFRKVTPDINLLLVGAIDDALDDSVGEEWEEVEVFDPSYA